MYSSDNKIKTGVIDSILQDTWLLALAIRNGQPIAVDDALYQRCLDMIQQGQDELLAAGAPEYLVTEITFAHCVFLDEAVLTQADTDLSVWYRRAPLQSELLGILNGGDRFYEHIKKLLYQPAPSEALVACYHRMLLLGYKGKYKTEDADERLTLLRQLETLLPEIQDTLNPGDIVVRTTGAESGLWRSPGIILTGLVLITTGLWAGLRLFLQVQ